MLSAAMDRYIEIQSPPTGQDSFGAPSGAWTTFANVWAAKSDIRARERFAADQDLAEEAAVFRIWWLAGVTPAMRIVHDSKTWEITGVAEVGRREGLEISAQAIGLPQG